MEPRDENMHGLWMWQFSMHRSKFLIKVQAYNLQLYLKKTPA